MPADESSAAEGEFSAIDATFSTEGGTFSTANVDLPTDTVERTEEDEGLPPLVGTAATMFEPGEDWDTEVD